MAESHVVSALKSKRAELSGRILALENQIRSLRSDLIHIDATLRIFVPDTDPSLIPPRQQRTRSGVFAQGELPRLVLGILRDSGAMPAQDIAGVVMRQRGLDAGDVRLVEEVKAQVARVLSRQKGLGNLRAEKGADHLLVWSITD